MKYPSLSMKSFATVILLLFFIACSKNTSTTNRGGNTNSDITVISDVKYGSNKNMNGNTVDLLLDVYIPAGATATQKFPLVFFVHGGGFTAGDKSSASIPMGKFADAGFVGVSIDYRLDSSIDANITDPCMVDSSVTLKTVYMSVQDARAAMRYIIANAAKYNIDTSRIFMNGNSAGAITVLNSYYLKQEDFNKIIPGVETELGGINNADNNYTNTFSIIAMAANSGCLPGPQYITSSNVVPTIFYHGGQDSVIPVVQGHADYCPSTIYIYGSKTLYNRLLQLGIPAVLHIDPTGGHGPYTEDFLTTNEICFFNSVLNKKVQSGSYTGQASSCQ